MKVLAITVLIAWSSYWTHAQQMSSDGGLAIGDKLPDLVFTGVYNHGSDTLRTVDLRGKLVILDFWNTYCISCLRAFPKVDSLQREYDGRIQILAVSKTGFQETVDFFDTHPNVHKPDIPFITGDTVLARLFPHVGDPYHVWIDPQGTVRHLASGAYLTREKLELALSDQPTGIPQTAPRTTYLKTLLDTAYEAEIAYASYLVRRNSGKRFIIEKPRSANEYTVSGSIQQMYQYLYRAMGPIDFNPFRAKRTLLLSDHPERYTRPPGLSGQAIISWLDKNAYYYQCKIPPGDSTRLFDWVRTDFERYFGLYARVERQAFDCWSLVRTGTDDLLATQGGVQEHTFLSRNVLRPVLPDKRSLVNFPFSFFSSWIISTVEGLTEIPVFDETGYSGHIDLVFSGETLDNPTLEAIQQELRAYGLVLRKIRKQMDVLVLRDRRP